MFAAYCKVDDIVRNGNMTAEFMLTLTSKTFKECILVFLRSVRVFDIDCR